MSEERGVEEAHTLSEVPGQKRRHSQRDSGMTLNPPEAGAADKDPASVYSVNLEALEGHLGAKGGRGWDCRWCWSQE